MKVTINSKTYRDWQLSFHDGHYRLLASMEENGIMTELKDYEEDASLAYIEFEQINNASLIGEEVSI